MRRYYKNEAMLRSQGETSSLRVAEFSILSTKAERTISECKNAEDKNVDGTNAERRKGGKKETSNRKK